jgi:hypothetical protein
MKYPASLEDWVRSQPRLRTDEQSITSLKAAPNGRDTGCLFDLMSDSQPRKMGLNMDL